MYFAYLSISFLLASMFWAFVDNALINMVVQIFLWDSAFNSCYSIPGSQIDELYDNPIFNFLRHHCIVFYSNCTVLLPTSSLHRVQNAFLIILTYSCWAVNIVKFCVNIFWTQMCFFLFFFFFFAVPMNIIF